MWFYSDKLQTKVREWMKEREEKAMERAGGRDVLEKKANTYQPDKLSKVDDD